MKNIAQRVIDILDVKAKAGARESQRNWYDFENDNGTNVGYDIESLIQQAKKDLDKYNALNDLFWLAIDIAYKEGWQSAYNTLGKYLGKEPTLKQVEKLYKSHFK